MALTIRHALVQPTMMPMREAVSRPCTSVLRPASSNVRLVVESDGVDGAASTAIVVRGGMTDSTVVPSIREREAGEAVRVSCTSTATVTLEHSTWTRRGDGGVWASCKSKRGTTQTREA